MSQLQTLEDNRQENECPSERELVDFSFGRLPESRQQSIAEHLSDCESCEMLVENLSGSTEYTANDTDNSPLAIPPEVAPRPGIIGEFPGYDVPSAGHIVSNVGDDGRSVRFQLREILGEGRFGRVFRARDLQLDRDIAVKIPYFAESISSQSLQLFLDEARLAARLRHPGIVTIYDIGRDQNHSYFIAMEFVEGRSLKDLLTGERPTATRAAEIIAQAARAAHYAHEKGVTHRDLKPANLLIDGRGQVRIADFGLALTDEQQRAAGAELAGTAAYMAPEQVRGETQQLDGRTDVWALGIVLYELLTGVRPFCGTRQQIFDQIREREVEFPLTAGLPIPAELQRICRKCLAKVRAERYGTARDLADDLVRWKRTAETRSSQSWLLPVMIGVVILAAAAGIGIWSRYVLRPAGTPLPAPSLEIEPEQIPITLDAAAKPFQWVPLLSWKPEELFRPSRPEDRWFYDPDRTELLVNSRSTVFLGCGETQQSRFTVEVRISKIVPSGSAGVFLGFRPMEPKNGRPCWSCQMVRLECREGNLSVSRILVELEGVGSGTFAASTRDLAHASIPRRPSIEQTLTIATAIGEIREISWQGQVLAELCPRELRNSDPRLNVRGKLGFVNSQGATTFSDARFMALP